MNILAIIPCRAGSKGVKKKNVRKLAGKPLITHTIEQARGSKLITRIVVSTDDPEAMEICKKLKCDYISRPEELATDTAPTLPVLVHAVKHLEEKENYKADLIVLLQVTTPFRTAKQIDEAIGQFLKSKTDSLMSVSPVPDHFSPYWQKKINEDGIIVPFLEGTSITDDKNYTRKQDLPKGYWKNGMIYIIPYDTLINKNSLFGDRCLAYVVDDEHAVNIDTEFDFFMAESILKYAKKEDKKKIDEKDNE
jgi:CMP-N,N'-diacetyllegionaminic acid synthase